jgi:hypothetical protein
VMADRQYIHTGVICLLDECGSFLSAKKYIGKTKRESIINDWKKLYGYGFNKCMLQIIPNESEGSLRIKLVLHDGKLKRMAEWAKQYGISRKVVQWRLSVGWSVDQALTTPARKLTFKNKAA